MKVQFDTTTKLAAKILNKHIEDTTVEDRDRVKKMMVAARYGADYLTLFKLLYE